MTEKTRKRLTEADLVARLAKKHPAPAWAFLTQVRNGTGYGRRVRTADAIAMSLWPSRGLELHGFEVKSYRGDWIHEFKTPEKAEEIARFCHRWWIVAEGDVVETAEIPPTWGLMVPHGSGLAVRKLADLQDAEAPTYPFLGALLRKVADSMVPKASIQDQLDERFKAGQESGELSAKLVRNDYAALKKLVAEFETASGVKLPTWGDATSIGAAVAFVLKSGPDTLARQIKVSRNRVAGLLAAIDEVIAEFQGGK